MTIRVVISKPLGLGRVCSKGKATTRVKVRVHSVADAGFVDSSDIWPISALTKEKVREEREAREAKARVVVRREEREKEFMS